MKFKVTIREFRDAVYEVSFPKEDIFRGSLRRCPPSEESEVYYGQQHAIGVIHKHRHGGAASLEVMEKVSVQYSTHKMAEDTPNVERICSPEEIEDKRNLLIERLCSRTTLTEEEKSLLGYKAL